MESITYFIYTCSVLPTRNNVLQLFRTAIHFDIKGKHLSLKIPVLVWLLLYDKINGSPRLSLHKRNTVSGGSKRGPGWAMTPSDFWLARCLVPSFLLNFIFLNGGFDRFNHSKSIFITTENNHARETSMLAPLRFSLTPQSPLSFFISE